MEKVVSLVGLLVSIAAMVLVIINTRHGRRREEATDWQTQIDKAIKPFEKVPDTLAELKAEYQVLKKQVEVFWKGVSFSSAQALHSPHTPELDGLLEKFQHDAFGDEKEIRRLKSLLREIANNPNESVFRQKMATDVMTLIQVRYEIGGELLSRLNEQDQHLSDGVQSLSRRLEH